MTRFIAKAHSRTNRRYSDFHKTLVTENQTENYALHHIYSLENTKHLLAGWEWTAEEIKTASDYITIDVHTNSVYIHSPKTITKRGQEINVRGISRYVSKSDYVQALIDRAWTKADPYKLHPGSEWDEMIAMGNTGDFYEVSLYVSEITCTCHAYSGLKKAFEQDAIAYKHLKENPITRGQLPDKHIFAVWKYLHAETLREYKYQYCERRDRFLEERQQIDAGDIEF